MGIQQPEIAVLNEDDELYWAMIERVYIEWLRHVGPQLDLDVSAMALRLVLSNIIGDDFNCFAWANYGYDVEGAKRSRKNYLERLNCEIDLPELPDEIRDRLIQTRDKITELDWEVEGEFFKAREIFLETKKWVSNYIDVNPNLKSILSLRKDKLENVLNEHWLSFLNTEAS